MNNKSELADRIIGRAAQLGFDYAAIVGVEPQLDADRYRDWLERGYHGEMAYLARPDAVARRVDPSRILPGVRSIVSVGRSYHTVPLPPELRDDPSRGVIASYAWGQDYHDVLTPRLEQLAEFIQTESGDPAAYRSYVDTGPVLERAIAARVVRGFIGKNTNLIHLHLGSWLFLGEILITAELPPTAEPEPSPVEPRPGRARPGGTCGQCTRCLDACPTSAFVAPYVLDARRCISYLTIELKGPIPRRLRPSMGNRIFGCDICQEVCPWNRRFARATAEPAFQPGPDSMTPKLLDLIALDEAGFRQRFHTSPIKRAKRRGLLRNVAVALGNWGDPSAVPALARALADAEPLVRGHTAWALGRIASAEARRALQAARLLEGDDWVRQEIELAMED